MNRHRRIDFRGSSIKTVFLLVDKPMVTPLLTESLKPVFTVDDVLSPYIYVFYASFIVAFLFTPIMRLVALYYGVIDQPDRLRKIHTKPVAYLGGIAVFLGWVAGLAISQVLHIHLTQPNHAQHVIVRMSIVLAGALILCLGLWDDIRGLKPWIKICGQVGAALILLGDGIGSHCAASALGPLFIRMDIVMGITVSPVLAEYITVILSGAMVIAVVVGCCNATNLMDGLDGLCGGVTAVIAAGFLFLAVNLAMYGSGKQINIDGLRVVLALSLMGAVLGFIPYNFNPASIFMGDTGSMFLGFSLATLVIMMTQDNLKWFLAAMVMFALPILDTTLAFARRYVNKRPFFSADRSHFHHQLVSRGFTVKQTVMISYGLSVFFVLLGASIVFMRTRYSVAVYLVVFGSIIVAAYKMGMIHEKPRIVTRRQLGVSPLPQPMAQVEANTVLEVREDDIPTQGTPLIPGTLEHASQSPSTDNAGPHFHRA